MKNYTSFTRFVNLVTRFLFTIVVMTIFTRPVFCQSLTIEQAKAKMAELTAQVKALDKEIVDQLDQAMKIEINSLPKGEFETTTEYDERIKQNEVKKAELIAKFDATKTERLEVLNKEIETLTTETYSMPVRIELGTYRADMERFPFVVPSMNKKGSLPVSRSIASQFKDAFATLSPVGYFQIQREGEPRLVYVLVQYNNEPLIAQTDRKIEEIKETAALKGHGRKINAIAFNRDGSLIASGSDDKLIKIWNVKQNSLLTTLQGHARYVKSLAFHPFEQILASGSDDGNVIIWQIEQSAPLRTIFAHEGGVHSVAISSDGNTLATAGFDKTIKLWNLADGQLLKTFTGHTDEVKSVAFSPDGWTLVSGSNDLSINLWNVRDGSLIKSTKGHLLWINSVAFSPDGELIASCSDDRSVKRWSARDLSPIRKVTGFSAPVTNVTFSHPEGLTLACVTEDGEITFVKTEDGLIVKTIKGSAGAIKGAEYDSNGKKFVSAGDDKVVKIWEIVYDPMSELASAGFGTGRSETNQTGLPPVLAADVRFSEPSGNNYLDANETGMLTISLKNTGKGTAVGVSANLTGNAPKELDFPMKTYIGDIPPDSVKTIEIPLMARYKIPSDSVSLVCNITETSGFNLDPMRIQFPTKEYNVKLVKAGVVINDNSQNGMIESGEIVDLTVRIQNQGTSIAKNVVAVIRIGDNVFYAGKTAQERFQKFDLGDISSGEFKDVSVKIFTNAVATEVPVYLTLSEYYREYGAQNIPLELAFNKRITTMQEFIVQGKDAGAGFETGGFSIDVEMDIPSGTIRQNDAVALIIANRDYQNADIPDVEYAQRDGEFMKQYLMKTLGYREGNIFLEKDATQSRFKTALEKLKNAAKDTADVFFYYVGHGAPDPEKKRGFFVPVDCDPNYVSIGGIGLDDFYRDLENLKARNITVVVDACFSGSSDKGMIIKNISPVMIEVEKKYIGAPNLTEFTSASGDEVSSWFPEKKHSLYTYYFLKGLQGEANVNKDGMLTVGELQAYLTEKIPYEARRLNNRQQTPGVTPERDNRILVWY
ncbi:MAG: caspase family protein [Candidatus Marinimicrobia bacterium]|nr:caspase family protein [Candidatus Neomarinimicrobiota bacterium]